MIHFIYLAAGNSRRFGVKNKLLYKVNGKEMFKHGLDMLCEICKSLDNTTLTVVTQFDEIVEYAKSNNISYALNLRAYEGISTSIKVGINAIEKARDGCFYVFVLADQPFLRKETVLKLIERAKDDVLTACVCCLETVGSPTMFSAKLKPLLLGLSGDVGGRAIMKEYEPVKVYIDDMRELFDIDKI